MGRVGISEQLSIKKTGFRKQVATSQPGLSIRGVFARFRINPKIRKINPKLLGFSEIRNPESEFSI